jgi:NADH-quinone oxidoreductase subunit M
VYILRVVGKILMGPIQDSHHLELKDASWFERLSVIVLIVSIFALGSAPFWISNMIHDSVLPVVGQIIK